MNPYKILRIKKNATTNELNKAYRNLAKIHHPDTNSKKTSKKFQQIKDARDLAIKNKQTPMKVESSIIKQEIKSSISEILRNQEKKDLSTRRRELLSLEKKKFHQRTNPIKNHIFNYYEYLAYLILEKKIDEKHAKNIWKPNILGMYEDFPDDFLGDRKELRKLYDKWKKEDEKNK